MEIHYIHVRHDNSTVASTRDLKVWIDPFGGTFTQEQQEALTFFATSGQLKLELRALWSCDPPHQLMVSVTPGPTILRRYEDGFTIDSDGEIGGALDAQEVACAIMMFYTHNQPTTLRCCESCEAQE